MSYQEKLICGQFVPLVIAVVYYFSVLRVRGGSWSLLGTIIALVVLQVVYLILVAIFSKKEDRDERDRLIEYKAYKVSYLVLMVVAFCWVAALEVPLGSLEQLTSTPVIVGVWVGIEIVRTGMLLVLHRTSVSV
jgi:hypothetical protein